MTTESRAPPGGADAGVRHRGTASDLMVRVVQSSARNGPGRVIE
ncbi:hypothetical protein [Streptomyces sp. NBC_01615]